MGVLQRECKNTGYTRRKPGQVIFGQEFDSPQLHQSRASTRESRSGLFFLYGSVFAFIAGIYFVDVSHQAEPGRTSRSGFSFLFCLFTHICSRHLSCQHFPDGYYMNAYFFKGGFAVLVWL